jgi:uncharacterized membrane protein YeaQ/YmgE (transglycosylase-associated protein family)
VATTAVTGAAGLVAGLVKPTGLVTSLEPLAGEPLPRLENLVFGGHELTDVPLLKRAGLLVDEGVIPPSLPEAVAESLEEADANVRPGVLTKVPAGILGGALAPFIATLLYAATEGPELIALYMAALCGLTVVCVYLASDFPGDDPDERRLAAERQEPAG